MRALIVEDGFQRGALAAARGLAVAGWEVGIGAPVAGLATASRFTARHHSLPRPDEPSFVDAVAAVAAGYDLVVPAGDGELLALSAQRARLQAVFPYAAHEVVKRALDKVTLADAAERVGIAVPGDSGNGPFVVKPRLTATPGALRVYARLAHDRAAAERQAAAIERLGGEPVVQAFVPGELEALTVVADRDGALVASVQQRADRIWPAFTGGSVRAVTVPVDAALRERVGALLREVGWFGLAQVQFQRPSGGDPVLIDLNGRVYGSLSLALAAGVNLPAIWAALATGRGVPPSKEARTGVRYHWLEGDLRRVAAERTGLGSALTHALRARHGLWATRDPVPALRHVARLLARAPRRLRRRSS
jgi:predicted ATP-grasp superfamily ATP-dependent carboligase